MILVRCINFSFNNVANGFRLLDKKAFFVTFHANKGLLKDISPSNPMCTCKVGNENAAHLFFYCLSPR